MTPLPVRAVMLLKPPADKCAMLANEAEYLKS
jgi:hypothetical protein